MSSSSLSDSRKRYGASTGSKAFYAYKQLVSRHGSNAVLRELPSPTVSELVRNSPVLFRAFELAGRDMSVYWSQYRQYKEFTARFGTMYGRGNLRRTYERYAVPLFEEVSPASLTSHTVSVEQFEAALRRVRGCTDTVHTKMIYQLLLAYEAAECLKQLVKPVHKSSAGFYTKLYKVYVDESPAYKYSLKEFKLLVDRLYEVNATFDASGMTAVQGLEFCKYLDGRSGLVMPRVDVLTALGFQHAEFIHAEKEKQEQLCKLLQRYNCASSTPTALVATHFNTVVLALGGSAAAIAAIDTMTTQQLAQAVEGCQYHKACYTFICYWLNNESKLYSDVVQEKLASLNRAVPFRYQGLTAIAHAKEKSEWRAQFIEKLLEEYADTTSHKTAYATARIKKLQHNVSAALGGLEQHVHDTYQQQLQVLGAGGKCDAVRWFVHCASLEMVFTACVAFARNQSVDNSRVRSVSDEHHAKRQVSFFIGMLKKQTFRQRLGCGAELDQLKPNDVLKLVENRRVPADSSVRRHLNDEEVQRLIAAAEQSDAQVLLLVTLLSEVALRIGALRSLKYHQLLDEFHTPRLKCVVVEKGNTLREFLCGPNLKRVIASYAHHFRSEDADVFVFGKDADRHVALSEGWVRNKLKTLAAKASITEVEIYPHMFRHTLVAKLLNEGNSSEIICKFIGHSSVDTTMKHYWTPTPAELMDKVVSSTLQVQMNKDEAQEEMEEEIKDLQLQLTAAKKIIDVYNDEMFKLIETPEINHLRQSITQQLPNIHTLLRVIESTVSGSTVCTQSTVQ